MPHLHYREVVFAGMHQRLQAAFPGFIGERAILRNPVNPLGSDAPLPALRCYDGGHAAIGSLAVGEVRYRLAWTVEGALRLENAAMPGTLDTAMNALHGALIQAIIPNGEAIEIPLANGTLEIWPEDTEFEVNRAGVSSTEFASVTFVQDFALEISINRGMPFLETL
jgi:hypothetical protein